MISFVPVRERVPAPDPVTVSVLLTVPVRVTPSATLQAMEQDPAMVKDPASVFQLDVSPSRRSPRVYMFWFLCLLCLLLQGW